VQSGRIVRFALVLAGLPLARATSACRAPPSVSETAASPIALVDHTCPPGARGGPSGCACRGDLRPLLGACVAASVAADACGPSCFATAVGCVERTPCDPGRARDLGSGECLARRDVRGLAASLGILVGDDDLLGCPPASELVTVDGSRDQGTPRLGCVPRGCGPRPSSDARASCPAGSVHAAPARGAPDPRGAAPCVPIFGRGAPGSAAEIDVARWVEVAIGADGGPGAPPLCSAWGRSAAFLGDATPTEARFVITLAFADNDVSLVSAAVRTSDAAAATQLDRALRPSIEALRALGGTANQAAVTTAVRCVRSAGARPSSLPAENDHER
jgi:hypothetical protein